jgi:hypothetical protein
MWAGMAGSWHLSFQERSPGGASGSGIEERIRHGLAICDFVGGRLGDNGLRRFRSTGPWLF